MHNDNGGNNRKIKSNSFTMKLTNFNYNAILNLPTLVSFNNPTTFVSTLNVSGNTTLNNITTCIASLNVSGNTTWNNVQHLQLIQHYKQ